jgi:hypothetical protein
VAARKFNGGVKIDSRSRTSVNEPPFLSFVFSTVNWSSLHADKQTCVPFSGKGRQEKLGTHDEPLVWIIHLWRRAPWQFYITGHFFIPFVLVTGTRRTFALTLGFTHQGGTLA